MTSIDATTAGNGMDVPAAPRAIPRRAVIAGLAGNVIVWVLMGEPCAGTQRK